MILPILHPADEPTPGIDRICIDPDPEITAILVEPVPEYTPADLIRDEMGLRMDFNINYHVAVRLTDHGRAIHRGRYDAMTRGWPRHQREYLPYSPPKTDGEGWSQFQLWDLMAVFGPHLGMTAEPAFEMVIRIPEGQS